MNSGDLSHLVQSLPQAVCRIDAECRLVWMGADFPTKTGLPLLEGQSLLDGLEPGMERDRLEAAVRRGTSFEGELLTCSLKQARVRVLSASGQPRWVLFEAAGLDDEIAFARALQEIARALGESMEVDAVCASAVLAMVRFAQVSRAEVYLVEVGQPLRRVASSDAGRFWNQAGIEALPNGAFQHALASGQPEIGVTRGFLDQGGTIFAAVPLTSRRRTVGLLVLYKDRRGSFSARELDLWSAAAGQLAVAVENARLLLEAQTALRVRDEFMSIASHELKTPLTPLKMCLYLMERRLMKGEPVELASIIKAKRQLDRLTALVRDLLDSSSLQLGQLSVTRQPLELGQLVCECVDEYQLAGDREFELLLPSTPVWVNGDRERLEQVVVNLLENAHKYSPPQHPVRVELLSTAAQTTLRVTDGGIGVPKGEQARIFQRFFRARNASDRHYGGLGLGLYISRSIVQLHGGELSLASEEGAGATFIMSLPCRMAEPEQARGRADDWAALGAS